MKKNCLIGCALICLLCLFGSAAAEEPACAHDASETVTVREPGCTEPGAKQTVCRLCGAVLSEEEIPPLGHEFDYCMIVRRPTEEEDGLKQCHCSRCGLMIEEILPRLVKNDWRYEQTVCSLGIRYRDIRPGWTEKWYMFTPLDLSREGIITYDLIASNIHRVGAVTVAVSAGKAVISYTLNKGAEPVSMGFVLFHDLKSVEDPEHFDLSLFAFDREISIEKDLAGDERVLLQIMGTVNYDYTEERFPSFSGAGKEYQEFVSAALALMDE